MPYLCHRPNADTAHASHGRKFGPAHAQMTKLFALFSFGFGLDTFCGERERMREDHESKKYGNSPSISSFWYRILHFVSHPIPSHPSQPIHNSK